MVLGGSGEPQSHDVLWPGPTVEVKGAGIFPTAGQVDMSGARIAAIDREPAFRPIRVALREIAGEGGKQRLAKPTALL